MDAHELPCHLEVRDCGEPLQSADVQTQQTPLRAEAGSVGDHFPRVWAQCLLRFVLAESLPIRALPNPIPINSTHPCWGPRRQTKLCCESFPARASALPRGWAWYWCVRPQRSLRSPPDFVGLSISEWRPASSAPAQQTKRAACSILAAFLDNASHLPKRETDDRKTARIRACASDDISKPPCARAARCPFVTPAHSRLNPVHPIARPRFNPG